MPATTPNVMPLPNLVPESEHWRARAHQCRLIAGRMRQDFARERMLNAAATFERSAAETREREIAGGVRRIGELMRELNGER